MAIHLENLCFGYPSTPLFQNFSWSSDADVSILEGPSGCGKTTFLRLLAGHLHSSVVGAWNVPRPARLVLQDDGLFPWLTALGNLQLVPGWTGRDSPPPRLARLAEMVDPYLHRVVGTLSFGQRRVLELLRVLSCPAPLMLLDEPLNFLDTSRRSAVIDSIASLASAGHRFVISSHYETDFEHLSCRRFRFCGDTPYQNLSTNRFS